jgi:acetyl-CoA carboxylase biotin carboxylase subunit
MKILVANRGEIALRIIRVARRMGVQTVLAASVADKDSLPAREADRTVILGPAQARDSYLNPLLLVHAAKATGCTALHPGYGFLSERAELAELCQKEGIIFIGPTAESIRQVGDKLSARALAKKAGIPMTSGSEKIADVATALKIADAIGYPVITKASAGGGGRGMVVARERSELSSSFEHASMTALEAFGDGTLYLERYVEHARHLEVQVMGDGLGNIVCFAERDCSIQRRYQKMLEEAPAEILSNPVRNRLHKAAIDLLSGIKYRNAGTVEFLYDVNREEFYFMEVNSRIQVEHPVSEEITGFDLIEQQIRVAAGEPLPGQDMIRPRGHAIEVRIIAEDADRDFMPSPGRITRWGPPSGAGVRVDSAMFDGVLVPPYYDSMIAKLITFADTRAEAIEKMQVALEQFVVEGISTNIPLLRHIVAHPDYRQNNIDTKWLEKTLLPSFRNE